MLRPTIVILIALFANDLQAQIDDAGCFYDLYQKASYKLYEILKRDTVVSFNDSNTTYANYIECKYRGNSIITINGDDYEVRADTIFELVEQQYFIETIPIVPTRIDTFRDPDDYSVIVYVKPIDSVMVSYAQKHPLNFSDYLRVMGKIKGLAEKQGLNVERIKSTIYNSLGTEQTEKLLDYEAFEIATYIKVNFYFIKNDYQLVYPLLFVNNNGG